jgi:Spy/CpxP family protein refolding chaperone
MRLPRTSRFLAAVLLTVGVIAPAFAQEARTAIRPSRHRFVRCLAILDLSAEQRTQIMGLIEAARPGLEADLAALRAAGEALRASLEADPPDACQIGNDALAVQAARETLIAAREALRAQITAVLTPEQQTRFEGCLDFSWVGTDALDDLLPE